jgi:predicted nucleic acid-binding protein
MENAIVFDTGPVISLTMNNLLWTLKELKGKFHGKFYITPAVYNELIKRPLETKRFKLEAMQILPLIATNVIEIFEDETIHKKTLQLLDIANKCFKVRGNWMRIVHYAEAEAVSTALFLGANTVVIDERTTRHLIEDPMLIKRHMERKIHEDVKINKENLRLLGEIFKDLKVIRSIELVTVSYELGLLDRFIVEGEKKFVVDPKKDILEGALWAIKLSGCSVREDEIKEIIEIEAKKR